MSALPAPVQAALAAAKAKRPVRTIEGVEAEVLALAAARAKALAAEPKFLARVADPAFARVVDNFVAEAVREPSPERYGMMVAAAAEGLVLFGRAVTEIARVERVLRELSPDDVRELRKIAAAEPHGVEVMAMRQFADGERMAYGQARRRVWEASFSAPELEFTRCVALDNKYADARGGKPLDVTARGELVLEVLRAWS